ncbi:MAG: hypothetical protein H7335_20055, partial [Massilia sp.]|nr:hypothetical protein [Massilia sp.]
MRRPVFLNLTQIHKPVGALTSISHRISGVVLAASVPAAIYVLALSLRDEAGFGPMTAMFGRFACTAAANIAVWGLRAWWVQRVSAIYMPLLIVLRLASLGLQPMHAYPQWRAWLTRPAESLP